MNIENNNGYESPLILFPHQPFQPAEIDACFADEFRAAQRAGFATAFYSHEALASGDAKAAFRFDSARELPVSTIFRGWMMSGENYADAHQVLKNREFVPCVSPSSYEEAHYLPFAYPLLQGDTARSEWILGDNADAAWQMYSRFRQNDCVIKDWVKSAKNRWKDACFIPAGCGEERFREIYGTFRQERGSLFNRGVVLREYLPLSTNGEDLCGMPIAQETRLFFWCGEILVLPDDESLQHRDRWEKIARRFSSPFITMDVGRLTDGSWKIIEVGDGGVSGLPAGLEPQRFYQSLWKRSGGIDASK